MPLERATAIGPLQYDVEAIIPIYHSTPAEVRYQLQYLRTNTSHRGLYEALDSITSVTGLFFGLTADIKFSSEDAHKYHAFVLGRSYNLPHIAIHRLLSVHNDREASAVYLNALSESLNIVEVNDCTIWHRCTRGELLGTYSALNTLALPLGLHIFFDLDATLLPNGLSDEQLEAWAQRSVARGRAACITLQRAMP